MERLPVSVVQSLQIDESEQVSAAIRRWLRGPVSKRRRISKS